MGENHLEDEDWVLGVILELRCGSWRQAIPGENVWMLLKCETHTMGALLRTRNGRSGLYSYRGFDPGGKLFRMRISLWCTQPQDLHDRGPLEDVERQGGVVVVCRCRSWSHAISCEGSRLVPSEFETYTVGVLLSTGAQ